MSAGEILVPIVAGLAFAIPAGWAVRRLESPGAPRKHELARERQPSRAARLRRVWSQTWKPLLAAISAAALAAGSAGEFTSDFGKDAQNHPVLTNALTGVALLGITALVLDVLLKRLDVLPWHPSLEATWAAVVNAGRRGAADVAEQLRGSDPENLVRQSEMPAPDSEQARAAYHLTKELQVELGHRVTRASQAARAVDQSELDESLNGLFSAADTLQRALDRYITGTPSVSAERLRTGDDIEHKWHAYVCVLLRVYRQGRALDYPAVVPPGYGWLYMEEAREDAGVTQAHMAALQRRVPA